MEENEFERRAILRRSLREIFGSFEEFTDRVNVPLIKHGLIRSKMRGRISPVAIPMASPSHLPVHVVLQSMKNLADEPPLSNLPPSLRNVRKDKMARAYYQHNSTTPSSSTSMGNEEKYLENIKRKRVENDGEQAAETERKKRSKFDKTEENSTKSEPPVAFTDRAQTRPHANSSEPPTAKKEKEGGTARTAALSPDSGVHSTENDNGEDNQSVEEMLTIMTRLEKPQLSPLPEDTIEKIRRKEKEKMEAEEKKRKEEEKRKAEEEKRRKEEEMRKEKEKIKVVMKNEKKVDGKNFSSVFNGDSTASEQSTPRLSLSPSPSLSPPPIPTRREEKPKTSGEIRLNLMKEEKLHKLIKLAKKNGCFIEDENSKKVKNSEKEREEREKERKKVEDRRMEERRKKEMKEKERDRASSSKDVERSEKRREGKEKERKRESDRDRTPVATNKKIQQVVDSNRMESSSRASLRPPSVAGGQLTPKTTNSAKNTPTTRPSSSMSANHESISAALFSSVINNTKSGQNVTPRPDSGASSVHKSTPPSGGSVTTTSFKCTWKNSRLKMVKRVPIPDPTAAVPMTKTKFYHGLAKEHKSKADQSKDRVTRILEYIVSSIYFVLEAISHLEKDRASTQGLSMFKETVDLLRCVVSQALRESEDPLIMHMLPRIKILSQTIMAVMYYQMYTLRAEQAMKNSMRLMSTEMQEVVETKEGTSSTKSATNKLLTSVSGSGGASAGSTPSNPQQQQQQSTWMTSLLANNKEMVTMPAAVHEMYKQQIRNMNLLLLAQRYWQDSKNLAMKVDLDFLKYIETLCAKPLSIDIQFEPFATFVLTAVECLKAEYEEEGKLKIRPVMAKMKTACDIAFKTGQFYTFHGDRTFTQLQQQSQRPSMKKS